MLVKCIAGFNVPTAGTITYDGVELRDLDVVALRQRLGFVMQTPYIFDDTIHQNVKENLDRLPDGRIAFIVAHRLSTIRDCDVIVVIEDGAIAEHGSHEALMRRDGLYAQQAAIG